jgi:hypothetical protein
MIKRVSAAGTPGEAPRPKKRAKPGSFSLGPTHENGTSHSAGPSPVVQSVGRLVTDLETQRKEIDQAIRQASRGRSFSPAELLVLQARVYSYSQEMEVVSRVVDKTLSAVKTTLNTQI